MEMNQPNHAGSSPLRRSIDGRMIGGVAAGLAAHFALEVTLVRAALVVLAILGGAGLALYLAAWLLIPEEGTDRSIATGAFNHAGGH
jgi:phage shock protein PspC (stress-responsive transcriptional regulator)